MKYIRLRSSYGKPYGKKVSMPTPSGNSIQTKKNFFAFAKLQKMSFFCAKIVILLSLERLIKML